MSQLTETIDNYGSYESAELSARERVLPLAKIVDILSVNVRAHCYIACTSGSWDIIHIGQTRYIEDLVKEARVRAASYKRSAVVVVGVNSDNSTRLNRDGRANGRPVFSEMNRAEIIANLKGVNMVFVFDQDSELPLIMPDMFQVFAQSDHKPEDRPEVWEMKIHGTSIREISDSDRPDSTSRVLARIHNNNIY